MNSVKSKNSHRNRLLQLLVDQQSEEESLMDDEVPIDDYELIMKSNFSMCSSTFANFGDTVGGAGPGGGGGNSPVEAKRKRTEPTPEPDENNYMDVDEMNIIMGRKRCCCGSEQEVNHELNAIRKELLKLDSHHCCSKNTASNCLPKQSIHTTSSMSSSRATTPHPEPSSSTGSVSSSSASTRSTSPVTTANRRHSPTDLLAIRFQIDLNTPAATNSDTQSDVVLIKPINNLLKYSLSNRLHLMRKDTLIFLIESNLATNLRSPFDQLAYDRLKRSNRLQPERSTKFDYNYASVRRFCRFLSQRQIHNPLDKRLLKQNALLPNCMSTFLMPFYFDIFKVTELSNFNQEQIQLMLALKRSFRAQIFLNYDVLITYLRENIVWNCFILFKYRHLRTPDARMGVFNFYLSFIYILIHLEQVINYLQLNPSPEANQLLKDHIRHAIELSNILPYLLDTLILTGLFKHSHYIRFKKFVYARYPPCIEQQQTSPNPTANELEAVYYERALKSVEARVVAGAFPMKLKALCRLKVNQCLSEFSPQVVEKLNIPKTTKTYLLYDNEIDEFFLSQQHTYNQTV